MAGGVGGSLWFPAINSQFDIQIEAEENANEYGDSTHIAVECEAADIVSASADQCIDTEREAAQQAERNERDLEAQKTMAVWTQVMGKAAIIGMGVGIVGLMLIFTTFWETRKAADSAAATYDAYVSIERAKLSFSSSETSFTGSVPTVVASVTNVGKSVGIVKQIAWGWSSDPAWPSDPNFTGPPRHEIVEPSKMEDLGFISQEGGMEHRFLRGYVLYESPLAPDHKTHFSIEIYQETEMPYGLKYRDANLNDKPGDT
ncbi:hypothetical protein HFP57_12590 [Parasphingopyxis algicola]|uniref:hypothetical protein n=1 Tax=Parasphingopyxis algicola TaxID=2026624 RepID=UPI00159FB36C|nr:hypothetical protein [Parasphingopyxis algicola]QLC25771.1 hypothetical protein HFP57_12590 [Parasphingopyxis algicola]